MIPTNLGPDVAADLLVALQRAGLIGIKPSTELFVYNSLHILGARAGAKARKYSIHLWLVFVGVVFEVDTYRIPCKEEPGHAVVEFAVLTTQGLSFSLDLLSLRCHRQ